MTQTNLVSPVRYTLIFLLTPALPVCAVESRIVRDHGSDYRVVDLDLSRDALEGFWRAPDDTPYASIEGLRSRAGGVRKLLFATNAGIYDREFRPLGLYVEDGRVVRPLNTARGSARSGNFSMQPNGVFYVDNRGHAGVLSTAAWQGAKIAPRLATQSGPMLVIDGEINPAFVADSESRKWRSGVCAAKDQAVTFAVSLQPVTFHAFATLFREQLGCRDALYLDGTLSQIYTGQDGYAGAPPLMVKPYAAILAVFDKPQ